MALPSSGQISMGDINVELGRSRTTANTSLAGSLFSLANNTVNKTAPHAISEFYGYSNITYTLFAEFVYSGDPCSPSSLTYNIYKGSDGKYYADQGGTFVLASTISSNWYYYSHMYNDGLQDMYVYDKFIATDGGFELDPKPSTFACAPNSV